MAKISERAVAAMPVPAGYDAPADINDTLAAAGFEVVKQVTRSILVQRDGVPFAVTFEGAAYEGQEITESRGGAKMEPARLCDVLNLITHEKQSLIMNTVLEHELERAYPNGSYVGKSFAIRGARPVDAEGKQKRYRTYEIAEIAVKG